MVNPKDPRVVRTRRMLSESLVHCILEKGYDDVTIQDITSHAGLRRATFYLHYRDKQELLLTILNSMFNELTIKLQSAYPDKWDYESEYQAQLSVFQHAQENADLYRSIANAQGSLIFLRYTREYMSSVIAENLHHQLTTPQTAIPIEVLGNYVASVLVNMVLWWLEKDMPYTVEEMARMCALLVLRGLVGEMPQIDDTV